jgi:protein TonB
MEGGRRFLRMGGPAAASLLVNALLIGVLLNLGLSRMVRRDDSPAMTVMSLAVLKGVEVGDEDAEATQPKSTPSETPPAASVQTPPQPLPKPVAVPATIAIASPLQRSIPAPAPTFATPAEPAASQTGGGAGRNPPADTSARRGTADGLDVKAPAGTSRSYAAKVRSWLYAHKIYPRRAKMRREEGRVRVRFVLDRAGMLIEGVIVEGSGNDVLDEEAVAMMHRSSPFPKAPVEIPGERIEFVAPIDFILPI